jgi:hypothetical protein
MTKYRRSKFIEILHEIREEMSREADYDVDLFTELLRRDGESHPAGFVPHRIDDPPASDVPRTVSKGK